MSNRFYKNFNRHDDITNNTARDSYICRTNSRRFSMSKARELANLIGNINAGGGGVNRNLIINGAMNVAQRGTSFTLENNSAKFPVDRFFVQDVNSSSLKPQYLNQV